MKYDIKQSKVQMLGISKQQNTKPSLYVNSTKLDQVDQFVYLWYRLNCNAES